MELAPSQQKTLLAIRIASTIFALLGLLSLSWAIRVLVSSIHDLKGAMDCAALILAELILLAFTYYLLRAGVRGLRKINAATLHSLLGWTIFFLLFLFEIVIFDRLGHFFPKVHQIHSHFLFLPYLALPAMFLQHHLCHWLYPYVPLTGDEKEEFLHSPSRKTIKRLAIIFCLAMGGNLQNLSRLFMTDNLGLEGLWSLGVLGICIPVAVVVYKALAKRLLKEDFPAPLPPANQSAPSSPATP